MCKYLRVINFFRIVWVNSRLNFVPTLKTKLKNEIMGKFFGFDKDMFWTLLAFGAVFTLVNHFAIKPGVQHLENYLNK